MFDRIDGPKPYATTRSGGGGWKHWLIPIGIIVALAFVREGVEKDIDPLHGDTELSSELLPYGRGNSVQERPEGEGRFPDNGELAIADAARLQNPEVLKQHLRNRYPKIPEEAVRLLDDIDLQRLEKPEDAERLGIEDGLGIGGEAGNGVMRLHPEFVSRGDPSYNLVLHELGHIMDERLGWASGSELPGEIAELSSQIVARGAEFYILTPIEQTIVDAARGDTVYGGAMIHTEQRDFWPHVYTRLLEQIQGDIEQLPPELRRFYDMVGGTADGVGERPITLTADGHAIGVADGVNHALRIREQPARCWSDSFPYRSRQVPGLSRRTGGRQPALGSFEFGLDISPRHELLHEEGLSRLGADLVDRDDVGGRAEAAHRLRFARDALAARVVEAVGLDEAECHVAVELGVVSEEDALLSTLTKQAPDLIAAPDERGGLLRGCLGGWAGGEVSVAVAAPPRLRSGAEAKLPASTLSRSRESASEAAR